MLECYAVLTRCLFSFFPNLGSRFSFLKRLEYLCESDKSQTIASNNIKHK